MLAADQCEIDRVVLDTGIVRIGAFRCLHAILRSTTPGRRTIIASFSRTAVEIQHEHQPAFAANPNVVTFYNSGQAYVRNAISDDGDRCDWFGMRPDIVQDVVRHSIRRLTRTSARYSGLRAVRSDAYTYFAQRRLFEQVLRGAAENHWQSKNPSCACSNESCAWRMAGAHAPPPAIASRQDEVVRHAEHILSGRWNERLTASRHRH